MTSSTRETGEPASSLRNPWLALPLGLGVAVALYRLWTQTIIGPRWDTFSFLANAAALAGKGYGYTEPSRPPLVSVVAAPLLRMGLMSPIALQLVDFAFAILCLAGVFALISRRVGALPAAWAAVAVLMAPPVWDWLAVGYTDISAAALCLWALLALMKATEDDPRYYSASFALLMCAALMRHTALIFALPMGVWMLLRSRPFRHARELITALLVAVAVYLPFGIYYAVAIGDVFYPFSTSLKIKDALNADTMVTEVNSYLAGLPILAAPGVLGPLTILVLIFAICGLALGVYRSLRDREVSRRRIAIALVVVAGAAYVVSKAGLISSQVVIAATVYLTWRLLASDERAAVGGSERIVPAPLALDATVVAWLVGFYVLHEGFAQRFTRYYITMAPQIAYFVALAWWQLTRALVRPSPGEVKNQRLTLEPGSAIPMAGRLLALPVIALVLVSLTINVVDTKVIPNRDNKDAEMTAAFLASQPGVEKAVVYSDQWPLTAWYLRRNIAAMPLFADRKAIVHELDKNGATYFIANGAPTPPPGFVSVFDSGGMSVFKRSSLPPSRPSILYLGAGWENYLELLGSYGYYVKHFEGDYNVQGTAFYDVLKLDELKRYPTVAAFGGMWHDRAVAERVLLAYVEQGGTLVFDASRNLDEPYRLDGSILFDTVIARELVGADSSIRLDPSFAARHSELGTVTSSPWISENAEPWYGAGYSALPGSPPLTVLARLGGRPLVVERRWGKGRVIWMAYNLAWHAKLTESADEARLIAAIMDEATTPIAP